jgi:2-polyprenyl-6-methoxyphenol hydroxylase-like FAD-dependent oxidoreductase
VSSVSSTSARSKTRRSIYVRGTVDDGDTGSEAEAAEYWTPLGLFGVSPLGDGTTYFYADATAADVTAAIVDLDLERFRSVWTGVLPACRGVLDRIAGDGSLLVNAVQRVDCDTFVDGRLVLLGDAAHAMEPTLGQGANSAFVDAAVLAGQLSANLLSEAGDVDHALVAYDARRRPAARRVQRAADGAARLAALHSSVAARVRNRLVRVVSASKFVEQRYRKLQQEDPAALFRAVSTLPGSTLQPSG